MLELIPWLFLQDNAAYPAIRTGFEELKSDLGENDAVENNSAPMPHLTTPMILTLLLLLLLPLLSTFLSCMFKMFTPTWIPR